MKTIRLPSNTLSLKEKIIEDSSYFRSREEAKRNPVLKKDGLRVIARN